MLETQTWQSSANPAAIREPWLSIDSPWLIVVTKRNVYSLFRINNTLDAVSYTVYFSTLDYAEWVLAELLSQDTQNKVALCTRRSLWTWKVLPFRLTSAPATCVTKAHSNICCLDYVFVFSSAFDNHVGILVEVLQGFQIAGLKLKQSKCEFFLKRGALLGTHGYLTRCLH